jgi:polyisoprenyl-teichoic acid--peptidoglycan teichoic acid transferase
MKAIKQMPVILFGVFIIALGLTAYATFLVTRELFISWNLPVFESTPFIPQEDDPTPTPPERTPLPSFDLTLPLQPVTGPQSRTWDGNQQITILLLGLDTRDGEQANVPPRSDTLVLFTYDPGTNTIGMLSIPRDLWVAIPGYGSGKINTAYQLGEAYQTSGGGPGLAMATIETLLGVPTDYYALMDFQLFARFIDEIGGVKIIVPEQVEIAVIDGKTKEVFPGLQTLSGDVALAYVRTRNSPGGDFDRVQRQQLVLMGIRNRILDFDLLPTLIAKAPLLYGEFSDRIRTNLTPNDLFKLAIALQGVAVENIRLAAITLEDVTFSTSPEGVDILLPIPERIRQVRDEVFVFNTPLSPDQANKTISQLIAEEAAKIAVLNGTATPGLAAQTSDFLKSEELNVNITDIATETYTHTTLIDYTGNPYTVQYLVSLMNINPAYIIHTYNPDSDIDIEITVGEDWVQSGALP